MVPNYLFIKVITLSSLSISTSATRELSGTRLTFLKFGDNLRQVACPLLNANRKYYAKELNTYVFSFLLLVIANHNNGMERCKVQFGRLSSSLRRDPLATQWLMQAYV